MIYQRDQLVRPDDDQFYECVLCGGYGPIESDIHDAPCVFFDPEVDRVRIDGLKRMADHTICGVCPVPIADCPACGPGWAVSLHTSVLKNCDRYKELFEK